MCTKVIIKEYHLYEYLLMYLINLQSNVMRTLYPSVRQGLHSSVVFVDV